MTHARATLDPAEAKRLASALTAYARLKAPTPAQITDIADMVIAAAVNLATRQVLIAEILQHCSAEPDEIGPLFDRE